MPPNMLILMKTALLGLMILFNLPSGTVLWLVTVFTIRAMT